MKQEERTLGDVAAELEGLEGLIAMIDLLVAPTNEAINGSVPTQETVDRAFFSIGETIKRLTCIIGALVLALIAAIIIR